MIVHTLSDCCDPANSYTVHTLCLVRPLLLDMTSIYNHITIITVFQYYLDEDKPITPESGVSSQSLVGGAGATMPSATVMSPEAPGSKCDILSSVASAASESGGCCVTGAEWIASFPFLFSFALLFDCRYRYFRYRCSSLSYCTYRYFRYRCDVLVGLL